MENILFKSKGSVIKDNGTLSDFSKKITLYINELPDEQIINLSKLVRGVSVDVIIVPAGNLDKFQQVFIEAMEMMNDENDSKQTSDTSDNLSLVNSGEEEEVG